jgi:hypothetical protein
MFDGIETKAIAGMTRVEEAALANLIEETTGEHGLAAEPLNASVMAYDNARALIDGARAPSPSEVAPLQRFRRVTG